MVVVTDRLTFMRSITLFKGLPEDQLEFFARASRQKTFEAGALIVGQEDLSRSFYVVMEGRVKLYRSSFEGREQTLNLFGPGELFGMCSAFTDDIFPAHAVALERSTILVFSGDVIAEHARREPAILFNLVFVLSHRLKEAMGMIESLALKDIPQRVASFRLLSTSSAGETGGDIYELPVTRRELSKVLGTTPETLSRVLKRMVDEGLIGLEGRSIRMPNRQAILDLADGLTDLV